MDMAELLLRGKTEPKAYAKTLSTAEIASLIPLLQEKDDALRYSAFLTLCARSDMAPDIMPYWETFEKKLTDENSYQRSIGLMLIAHNTRWDTGGRFGGAFDKYMACCNDESFVTRRQAIQSIKLWAPYGREHLAAAAKILMAIDVAACKETQRKLLLQDICATLVFMAGLAPDPDVSAYLNQAVTGGILDKKTAKRLLDALP